MIKRPTYQNMVQRIGRASLLLAFFLPTGAQGATSEWMTSTGGMIRIVAAPLQKDGTIPATLEVKLNPGWKTYWREPGASGIPPQITLDPAEGVVLEKIGFPVPKTFNDGVVRYVGYDKSVAFPLTLKRLHGEGDVRIRASVFLGICEDICIPVQGELDLTLKHGDFDNPLDAARIDGAVAALPELPSEDFQVTAATYDEQKAAVHLSLRLPLDTGMDHRELFLAGASGVSFGKPVITKAEGAELQAEIPVRLSDKDKTLKGKPVILTVRAGGRSMETTLAFD
ncbi:protein-disulfide reductase DsbD domain-containing protein [Ensifer canadensis]